MHILMSQGNLLQTLPYYKYLFYLLYEYKDKTNTDVSVFHGLCRNDQV